MAAVDRLRFLANDLGYLAMWRWRWEIYAGDAALAAQQLGFAVRAAANAGRRRRAHKLGVLHALALHRTGRAPDALPRLQEVLKATCPEGYMALALDEGPLLARPRTSCARCWPGAPPRATPRSSPST